MAEEEKGFIIKDRRSFDERGELKEEPPPAEGHAAPAGEEKQQKSGEPAEASPAGAESDTSPPLPEVNFNSLIFSLSSSALLHLGEIPDPQTGQTRKELQLARHTIDTIAMLKEKTTGNLTDEEQKFLDSILADLRWRYVKSAG